MSVMHFLPELKAFLIQEGVIYTVRMYRYTNPEAVVSDVGRVERTLVAEGLPGELDLASYVTKSGFGSVEAWLRKIRHFIPESYPAFLYKVVVKE